MYSREMHKPTLACEKRRERNLPLADYILNFKKSHPSSRKRACSRAYKRERDNKTTKDN
jgi:hypothetical protein